MFLFILDASALVVLAILVYGLYLYLKSIIKPVFCKHVDVKQYGGDVYCKSCGKNLGTIEAWRENNMR